jgi:hypothetical protein
MSNYWQTVASQIIDTSGSFTAGDSSARAIYNDTYVRAKPTPMFSTTVAFFDGIEREQPWRLSDAVVARQTKPVARRAPVRWQERDGRGGA